MTPSGHPSLQRAAVVVAACALFVGIGCDHPKSECDDNGDCPGEQLCLSVADRPSAPALEVHTEDLRAPVSSATYDPVEAIEVAVSPQFLRVNDTQVAEIPEDFTFAPDEDEGGIAALREALTEAREKREKETALLDEEYTPRVVVTADQATPNRLIYAVLHTVGQSGINDIRLATRRVEHGEVWRD